MTNVYGADRRDVDNDSGTVATDRFRFAYVRAGSGPPVLVLPGAGGWRLTFEALVERLAAGHTAYALDPPGQGGTRVLDPAFTYDADAIADSMIDFLDLQGVATVALLGHSWGGGFALRLAQRHPARVTKIALLAPAGIDVPDSWEFRLLRLPPVGELATRFASATSMRHLIRKSFHDRGRMPSDNVIMEAARELSSGPDAASLRRELLRVERTVRWTDTEQGLSQVTGPVMILWGAHDRIFAVEHLARFTDHLPDVRAHVLAGAGHSLHEDRPDLAYPLLINFLADKDHHDHSITT